ncbi:Demethylmenaquinone methyltransferase [Hondaea fermentalgiana]|uniref:Demethylmenaquinone methyltransferase n=1 Tax=Hondaea fermentalgiana TaxID=2315210 RepID=A0A2R5GP81_9STRA|nr:Demethylmenaquinone methyltransferase [Hondaea fermentalgiana]|eukprot:GBG32682.1 Demethylmenaquinone methyltransferase [Hondaea fermentalgiana]
MDTRTARITTALDTRTVVMDTRMVQAIMARPEDHTEDHTEDRLEDHLVDRLVDHLEDHLEDRQGAHPDPAMMVPAIRTATVLRMDMVIRTAAAIRTVTAIHMDEKAEEYAKMEEGFRLVQLEQAFLERQEWWPTDEATKLVTLDFGCGPGHLLCNLGKALAPGSCGLDVSKGMLKVAQRRATEQGLDNVLSFTKNDPRKNGQELETFAGKADFAMVCFVLHHTMEPQIIFEHLCQTIKPGGHLLVCEFDEELPEATLAEWMEPFGLEVQDTQEDTMKMRDFAKPIKFTIAQRSASA